MKESLLDRHRVIIEAILPAAKGDIPMRIFNTFTPTYPGIFIVREPRLTTGTVKAISVIKGMSLM